MAFFSIGDDLHHIRLATEASLVEQKAANALLTALVADVAQLKAAGDAIAAGLKELADALSEPPVVGINADFKPPETRP